MHIAFITPEYPHSRVRNSAGIGTSIKNLALGILSEDLLLPDGKAGSLKHKISIIIYGQKEEDSFKDGDIHVHLIKRKQYRLGGFYWYRKYVNRKVNALVLKNHIDILEAPDWTGITAFMKFKIPHVIRLHGTDTYFCNLEQRPQKKKNYFFEEKALTNADAITSVSRFTASKTKELFNLSSDITVIHNLIDTSLFVPKEKSSTQQIILYFGSVIRKKGVLALSKAFNVLHNTHPKVKLLFLGKDVVDYQEQRSTVDIITETVSKSTLNNIQFVSEVSYERVQEFIAEASVICLPSYAEAFPMTWLEAMAMQKPMVTSNIGWASEIMENHKTGITVDPNNIEDLAGALQYTLDHKEESKQFGKAARERLVSNFNRERIVQENITFYKKVLGV